MPKTETTHTKGPSTLKQITDGIPDCACKFVPGMLNLQRCPLHAAAPDLLEAAKEFLAWRGTGTNASENARLKLRAAIRKAEGE
mgnify:CR=1 FL=1